MDALSTMARTWPMLSSLGAGLVLLALAAGAGGTAGVVLVGAGAAGLGWGVLSLRAGRALAPRITLGVAAALLVAAGALVGSGLTASAGVRVGPLVAASVFVAIVAGQAALVVRRRRRNGRSDPVPDRDVPRAAVDGRLSLVGLLVGALLVAGLATPALAATRAGQLAVPHGEHGTHEPATHGHPATHGQPATHWHPATGDGHRH